MLSTLVNAAVLSVRADVESLYFDGSVREKWTAYGLTNV